VVIHRSSEVAESFRRCRREKRENLMAATALEDVTRYRKAASAALGCDRQTFSLPH
jgi:hypothetical protein